MYVKSLTIKNYRNFGDPPFELELMPFTLILGENNVGKTNLLNALGLIFSQEIMIFRKRVLEIDDMNYRSVEIFKDKVRNLEDPLDEIDFPVVSVEVILTGMDDDQQAVVGTGLSIKSSQRLKLPTNLHPQQNLIKQRGLRDKGT